MLMDVCSSVAVVLETISGIAGLHLRTLSLDQGDWARMRLGELGDSLLFSAVMWLRFLINYKALVRGGPLTSRI